MSDYILSLHPYVIATKEVDVYTLKMPGGTLSLKKITPGLKAAFESLLDDGATEKEMVRLIEEKEGEGSLATFFFHLHRMRMLGLLCYSLYDKNDHIATLTTASLYFKTLSYKICNDQKYMLSRFAVIRHEENHLILESPIGHSKITLHHTSSLAVINKLTTLNSLQDLKQQLPDVKEDIIKKFLIFLQNAEVLCTGEEKPQELWTFHDLLFHSRSRMGRHSYPFGGNYRHIEKMDPLPAVKERTFADKDKLKLYQPSTEELKQKDLSLTLVQEKRESIRDYSEKPITDQQLGEFLFRSARIKEKPYSVSFEKGKHTVTTEHTKRPYPSGGASYELEIYLAINKCENIDSGFYYYDALNHQLCKLFGKNRFLDMFIDSASTSAARRCVPQIAIVISARFGRIFWKYDSMGYAVILKNLGVLYQTMYLVATAMGLAPCALGAGDSDLFSQATKIDYYEETSVGEFMLGSKLDT